MIVRKLDFKIALLILGIICVTYSKAQNKSLISNCSFLPNVSENSRIICGKLEVPENHQKPNGRKIEIAYVIIKSENAESKEYPMIHFTGGPGGQSLRNIPGVLRNPILKTRDIIRFDQRGIGYSSPLPDLTSKVYGLLPLDITIEQERKSVRGFLNELNKTLKENNIEIETYNTFQNALDVGMLMDHLGYEKYNLRGGSYGTRIARVVADYFPEKINAAIYDSPAPHRENYLTTRLDDYNSALSKVIAQLKSSHPDLEKNYFKTLNELAENPIEASYNGKPFYLNPQDAIFFIRYQLYSNAAIRLVPAFIEAVLDKDMDTLNNMIAARAMSSSNYAMFLACENFDEYDDQVTTSVVDRKYNQLKLMPYQLPIFTSLYLESKDFLKSTAPPEMKEYKVSEVPSLIFVNYYDPVTPPENAAFFQSKMTKSHAFILDQAGHGGGNMACKRSIMDAFMSNPDDPLDTGCLKLYDR